MKLTRVRLLLVPLVVLAAAGRAPAQTTTPNQTPEILRKVGLDQHLDQLLPAGLRFTDHAGNAVRLGDYFGERPVLMVLAYYECPMLCTLVLNGMQRCLRAVALDAGADFDVLVVSIDPGESPELAARARQTYIEGYGREGAEAGFHFLVGAQDQIEALADAAGFRYAYDAENDEYAHPSTLILLTPEGKVSRYYPGVEYAPRDVRLGLVEASQGGIGTVVDQVLLFCYQWDPQTGRYGLAVMNALRLGGGLTLAGLVGFVVVMLRRDRRRAAKEQEA